MLKRWLINFGLLLLVAGLIAFVYLKPKAVIEGNEQFEISRYKLSEFSQIKIDFPAKASVEFKKIDGFWRIVAPLNARADSASVFRLLSIVAAKTETKITPAQENGQFSQEELEKFGLINPSIKLNFIREDASKVNFLFGTFNPISEQQYIAHSNAIYLLPVNYSEAAATQTIELVDKAPLKQTDKVVGVDFSHLEQWEENRLKLNFQEGKWALNLKGAKPDPVGLGEWFTYSWVQTAAEKVELYTPKQYESHPYVIFKMADGSKVRFDKLQESPKLILAKPDEGLLFYFPADAGFSMLNPPVVMEESESTPEAE